jgi:crossover junction endodeoxyribonuclease RuvC
VTKILAIDGASTAGFAIGAPGEEPRFSTRQFTGGGATGEVVGRFCRFMRVTLERHKPTIITYEAPYVPTAWRKGPPLNARTVRRLLGLAEIIDAIAWEYQIRCYQATAGEVTAYLTGKANWGGREAKKAATIAAARRWGWAVSDDNQADALAVWAFTESILDPVAAALRRARLGLELPLENEDTPRRQIAGRRAKTQGDRSGRNHKRRGDEAHGRNSDIPATGELQFAT